jgi:branched-chain amino acid aminotransferase
MGKSWGDDYIWFNGSIMLYNDAKINIMNTSAQYGINVFEGIRCYYSSENDSLNALKLIEHLERLLSSAKLLRLNVKPDITIDYLLKSIKEVVKANNLKKDTYIKIGIFIDDEGGWNALGPTGMYILPFPKGRVFTDINGLKCCVSSWTRIGDSVVSPRIKAGANYINSRYAMLEAQMNGYDSPILLNSNGKVSEGPGSCLFMVRNGKLVTPSITSSILESITRESVIEIAKKEFNILVEERDVDRTELYLADELLLVGTMVEIEPVLSVDGFAISESIGPVTSRLRDVYMEIAWNRNKKYSNWLTKLDL